MRKPRCIYSVEHLKRLWADGKTHIEIAAALGCPENYVAYLVARHNLPRRRRTFHGPQEEDPTPEQIAERAAECRARRPPPAVPTRERTSVPKYSWDGYRFNGIG